MTSVAVLLGNDRAHWHYREQGRRIRAAFDREYASPNGRLSSDSQTAYALALQFDLLTTQRQRDGAGARLGQLVADADYHIESGFLGTPLLADALTSAGRVDDAYCLLMQTTCPSWLYPVTQGATTVWERWDSMLPDGTLNPGDMTSFNHYALGAVADWMHRCIAGLAPDLPGYRRIRVHPRPGGGLTHVSARHETRFGSVAVEWRRREERFALDIRVPDDTSAVVILPEPGWKQITVGPGRHSFECAVRPAHADPVPDPAT
jgi:alpha-L-rhamnosidase